MRCRLDVDAARSSFAPPAINAAAPAGLHPALHARLSRTHGPLGVEQLLRAALADPDARQLLDRFGRQSSSLLTVAQLRTVAVPARPGLPSAFISLEFCMPSGHQA